MANPLVAEREDSTKSFSGIQIAESVDDTKKAIESGDWAAGVMGAVGTGLDALSMALDPFGAILAAGVGWLMEHVGPVSDALDSLTGDPDEIKSHSETWKNISAELEAVNTEMKDLVKADVANWMGEAADAYRARSEDTANLIAAAKSAADGAADGIGTAGEVVAAVRTLVRDIIAELVGHLVSWALQVICTLGIAMAWVVPQVVAEVAKVAAKIADITTKLVKAMKALSPLLKKLGDGFGDATKQLDKIKKNDGKSEGPASTNAASTNSKPDGGGPSNTNPQSTDRSLGNNDAGPANGGSSGPNTPANTNTAGANQPNIRDNSRSPEKEATPDKNKNTCGDPIDVASGDVVLPQTDVEMAGVLPLVLRRLHLSSYRVGRFFGSSWASTLDQRLEVDEEGVSFAGDDGTLLFYPHPTPTSWPHVGPRKFLARTDTGYTITDPEGQKLHFGIGGAVLPLLAITDRNGNRVEFDRDDAGVPTEIRHSGGYRIRVETSDGLITALHLCGADDGADLQLVRYGYRDGRLAEVINASGVPLRFAYDHAGRLTSWTDRNGAWYRYAYDHEGRVVRADGSGGFFSGTMSYADGVTRWTNSLGQQTAYHLNERGQTVREVDPAGNEVLSEWDEFDRLLERADPLGRVVRYEYGATGGLIAVTQPDGSQARIEYNDDGLPVTVIAPDGTVSRHEYDVRGNVVRMIDPVGAVTRYSYDERGHLSRIVDPLGGVCTVESDVAGLPVSVTDATGATARYERDGFGRVTAVVDPVGAVTRYGWTVDGAPAWRMLPNGATERWVYDGEGNLRTHVDPLGQTTHMEVAQFDLPLAEVRPDGTRLELAYDTELRLVSVRNEQGNCWRYRYDLAGNLAEETDFDGRVLRYTYDAAGQMMTRTNGAGETIRFVRDVLGRIVEQSAGGITTRYEYDLAGRLARATNPDADLQYTYDECGRVLAEVCNGRVLRSEYDQLGRRVRRTLPSGTSSEWRFDAAGAPVGLRIDGHVMTLSRDLLGRDVERAWGEAAIRNDWDTRGLLTAQTVSTATGVQQRRSYDYRADGLLRAVDDALAGTSLFDLDPLGRITGVTRSAGSERYSYDATNNLVAASSSLVSGPQSGPREFVGNRVVRAGVNHYEHDAQGRLLRQVSPGAAGELRTAHFEWNAEDRLVAVATLDGQLWRYRYDALGRRVAKQQVTANGEIVEQIEFTWDGSNLAEEHHLGPGGNRRLRSWEIEPETDLPLIQGEKLIGAETPQHVVDQRFHAIVTDLVGTPTELVGLDGSVRRRALSTIWGEEADRGNELTPLRFPGQYFDAETGLHYNYHRYFDPGLGRYISADPLGLEGGANGQAYVSNPTAMVDPLGLMTCGPSGGGRGGRDRRGGRGQRRPPYYDNPLETRPVTNPPAKLYHYTNSGGMGGISTSGHLRPSVWQQASDAAPRDGAHARFGSGAYLTDIQPGTLTPAQLSQRLQLNPHGNYSHYIEVDTHRLRNDGYTVAQATNPDRPDVFVAHHNNEPLNSSSPSNVEIGNNGAMTDYGESKAPGDGGRVSSASSQNPGSGSSGQSSGGGRR